MKVRIKFSKGEEVKYIGHLDVMRLFQRANKRANLPMAYSTGFNPHQMISFANPLSLGMTSDGEYGDFELTEWMEPTELVDRLNACLPDGVRALLAVPLKQGTKKAMADVSAARYEAVLPEESSLLQVKQALTAFLSQKEIVVMKKTKNHTKETNIRPDIYQMEATEQRGRVVLQLFLAAGSERNVKASLVCEAFYHFMRKSFPKYQIAYKRMELYRQEKEGSFVPLYFGVSE